MEKFISHRPLCRALLICCLGFLVMKIYYRFLVRVPRERYSQGTLIVEGHRGKIFPGIRRKLPFTHFLRKGLQGLFLLRVGDLAFWKSTGSPTKLPSRMEGKLLDVLREAREATRPHAGNVI